MGTLAQNDTLDVIYITTIYSKLTSKQKKKIINFLKNNFSNDNNSFDFDPSTIIILSMLNNEIIGCICLFDNKFLLNKLNINNISTEYYSINNSHGCFIYNFCVDKNHRNKKVGFNLLRYTLDKMKSLNIDYLHTQAENEISHILFLKNGFMEDTYFQSPSNQKVFVMSKYL
uniref:N-acetyltransferase domain-containing protein n=1 Tax=viral metagenome TaxID=1070528 RepID=A0A6C0DBZ1_9ZZZZ